MALPTNRTTSTSIADHVADHNVLHEQHNDLEGHAEATTEVHGIADTSQLATNADVAAAVAGLVDSAPATLDTLNELAAALGDDESFATTVTTALAGKAATGHDHDVDYEAAGAVATHAADTTDVHGIADTSALALTSHTHSGTYVPLAEIDAKGDLLVGSAADTLNNLGVGTDGHVLTADSAQTLGVKWAAAAGGSASQFGPYMRTLTSSRNYGLPGWIAVNAWGAGSAATAGQVSYTPIYVPSSTTFDRIAISVSSAAAAGKLARLGIYDATGTNGLPGALVLDGGTVAVDALGAKEVTISQTLATGRYWLAFVSDGTPTCLAPRSAAGVLGSIPFFFAGTMDSSASQLVNYTPNSTGRTADVAGGLQATAPTLSNNTLIFSSAYPYLRYA